ncbi:Na+ driven multidrug efflux pump [Vibrio ponticus]|nr:Na+ driven multidrug efflux pump [Vibrio ponticus]
MSSLPNAIDKRMSILALTWPLFIEIMLRTALNTSDVFMLSAYSDKAVSAVG